MICGNTLEETLAAPEAIAPEVIVVDDVFPPLPFELELVGLELIMGVACESLWIAGINIAPVLLCPVLEVVNRFTTTNAIQIKGMKKE